MIKESDKFIINCNEQIDENIFNIFFNRLKNEFEVIDSFFDVDYDKLHIHLTSKSNLDLIVKAKSTTYKEHKIPSWLIGFSTFEEVFVLSPTAENIDEIYKVALHETVHLISYKLSNNQKRLKLLDEGIAVFLSNQYIGKTFTPWVNAYLKNKLPLVSDFCTFDSLEFADKNGYKYSYCIIEFLLNTYGKEIFIDWLQKPLTFLNKIDEINVDFNAYITKKIEARIK